MTAPEAKQGTELANRNYIRWDSKGVEDIPPGEKEIIEKVGQQFRDLIQMNFDSNHHAYRGTHLKTQGCVKGKLKVLPDLPNHLRQGMFKDVGKTYDIIFRYSSLTPRLLPDTVPAPRGAAFKVFGVKGDKIFQTPDMLTQDFTFNNYTELELRTAKDTYDIVEIIKSNWDNPEGLQAEVGKREDKELCINSGSLPREHMAAMTQYSQSAYRHGDYVAKYALIPATDEQKALRDWRVKDSDPPNVLSQTLRDHHQKHKVKYALGAQLLENLDEQSVENLAPEWNATKYPFQLLGFIEFEPQDSWLPSFRNYFDDQITLNGWHGLKEHQPLGSTNRTRRVVYAESRKLRMKINAKDCVEPKSVSEVPA